MAIERERRWICHDIPTDEIIETEAITDLYVTGTQMRLREARPISGKPAMLRLSRKADVDDFTRLITSIYLPEQEFAVLAEELPGVRIVKIRHRLKSPKGVAMLVDEFQGDLEGLVLAEAEFETNDIMSDFQMPKFAGREVTRDVRFTGGYLIKHGLPDDI